jgi:peptidoglycan hydrolase-like protein with peptidoglycan-binding domain
MGLQCRAVRKLALFASALLAVASSYAATPAKTTPAAKPAGKPAAKTTARPRSYSRYRAPAAQQVPTPERYKEIQQALADKGYFKGNVDGQWNPESVDALKRFQGDQNLAADGKIGSLSLIGLGLGPKRMTAQSAVPPEKQ